jgi:F0F1-type ATP synthase assembly protein I
MAAVGRPPGGRKPDGDSSDIQRASADGLSHGITIAVSVALFLWLGDLLDQRIGTSPLFAFLGILLGAGGGFYRLYANLVLIPREEARLAAERDRESREDGGS